MVNKGFHELWIKWMRMFFTSGTSAAPLMVFLARFSTARGEWGKGTPCPLFFLFLQLILYKVSSIQLNIKVFSPHLCHYLMTMTSLSCNMQMILWSSLKGMQGNYFSWKQFSILLLSQQASKSTMQSLWWYLLMSMKRDLTFWLRHLVAPKGTLPFTYLGLPQSLTKPIVTDFLPLVSKCERRLTSISSFLSQQGCQGRWCSR